MVASTVEPALRVLVVDDSEVIRALRHLRWYLRFHTAPSGIERVKVKG